jgi:signal transduction histidine kinase/ligand-binding sensor domain-containing protein
VAAIASALLLISTPLRAAILWSDLGATLVHDSGPGSDILGGALKRDDASSDTLYFKFHVDPLSDASTEEYFAGFQLFEGDEERLGIGNSLKAWAYSAFNTSTNGENNKIFGDMDLRSSQPESAGLGLFFTYEVPRRGIERTIVFKVQYMPGGDDLVSVWLNPDLAAGATEENQFESLTTTFKANAGFDQVRLRHGGGGNGWTFSDMLIATSFEDFVAGGPAENAAAESGAGRGTLPLTFLSLQREQGLPQNSVRALAQGHDGYLWVGSDDGLARFDGVRFVSFGMREGVPSGPVCTLFEDSGGTLWIGSLNGGLTRRKNGQFNTLTMRDGLPADSITALAEDIEGQLWVGTDAGLVVLNHGKPGSVAATPEFKGRRVTALFKDGQGTMWVGIRGEGVYGFKDGRFVPLPDPSAEQLLKDTHCLMVDRAGRTWIGAGDDFVLCRDGGEWRRYRIPRHLARPYITALVEESDGTVWAGSVSEGLFEFKQGKLAAINASSGLLDNFVESLLVDGEGDLWVGTSAGLNRLRRSNLSILGANEGLGYGAVQGLAEIAPGLIWAGKPSDGLYGWDGRKFSRLNSAEAPRQFAEVNSLLQASDGTCWAAGARGLIHFTHPRDMSGEADAPVLEGFSVAALAEDSTGDIWAGTREGELWRRHQGAWMAQPNYPRSHVITALAPSPDGSLWIGTEGSGLYQYRDKVMTHLDKSNGLLSDLIRALYLGSGNTLWIGTVGGGLSQWHPGRVTTLTTREGLPDNTISQILEDDAGRLWLGCNRGIASVSRQELEQFAKGQVQSVYPRVYGRLEGMPSEECTGGFCPAGLKTKAGFLWFSTLKGIAVVDPHPRAASSPAPAVMLEEVLVDGAPGSDFEVNAPKASGEMRDSVSSESSWAPLRVPPGNHRIEFRYTGLSFNAPERVRFRYRLQPLDADWIDAGARRTALYNYVPPGEYHFLVIACNSDGIWNETGAGLALTVRPHLWQVWWFNTLLGLGLLCVGGGSARLVEKGRLQRKLKQLELERALERERARIAQDLHDDLGSSLARISLLSGLLKADREHPEQVQMHADKISQSADQTVRALEEIVWAVRPDSDSLQSLVDYIAHFANELFEANPARCRLDLPHDLPAQPLAPDVRHNMFLIVKEALTNALKHAGAKEVRVQAKASASALEISIQDDGRGFDPATLPGPGKRHGLGNMRQRAIAIGGTLKIETSPGKGTEVRLTVTFPGSLGTRLQGDNS